jgi:flagellar motor switch protein FliN
MADETRERGAQAEPSADSAAEFEFPAPETEAKDGVRDLNFILDIPLTLSAELGRTRMPIGDLLQLGEGAVIELDRPAGGPVDILANERLIARGEVVTIQGKYGVRIVEIVSPAERIERLG